MNFHNYKEENPRRLIKGLDKIFIPDNFGNFMHLGDLVQVHVMPFDYVNQGRLEFDYNECKFFVNTYFGKHSLALQESYNDMQATIKITKTFKLITEE